MIAPCVAPPKDIDCCTVKHSNLLIFRGTHSVRVESTQEENEVKLFAKYGGIDDFEFYRERLLFGRTRSSH